MKAWQSGFLPVADGQLAFHRTGGDGPPLVLSHGLTDNGLCWTRFAAAMASEFDVIMLDARGHGRSSRPSPGKHDDPAEDIAQAIQHLGLVSPIVMGHSVGARASAAYAGSTPGSVSKLILEDPPLLPLVDRAKAEVRRERFRRQVERFQSMSEAAITAEGKASSPLWHADDFPAWAAAKTQVDPDALPTYETPWQYSISRIAAPTLLIHGDPDLGSLVTPELADEARSINSNVIAVRVRGAGHNVRRENFLDFVSAVCEFLG